MAASDSIFFIVFFSVVVLCVVYVSIEQSTVIARMVQGVYMLKKEQVWFL